MALMTTQRKAVAAVLVLGVALGLTPAFTSFAPGRSDGPWLVRRLAAQTSSSHVGIAPHSTSRNDVKHGPDLGQVGVGRFATATLLAMATMLVVQRGRRTTLGGLGRDHELVPMCNQVAPPAFAGNFRSAAPPVLNVRNNCVSNYIVARKGMKNCTALWFKRIRPYSKDFKRNIRNRSYNLALKVKYKQQVRYVSRFVKRVEFNELKVTSLEDMVQQVKSKLDKAYQYIDFVVAQGVLTRQAAGRIKERLCKMLVFAARRKRFIEAPDEFLPAYKIIGYEPPVFTFMREPRPWQLPAWKNPYQLKREYDKWSELKPVWKEKKEEMRKQAEEAKAAAEAVAAGEDVAEGETSEGEA